MLSRTDLYPYQRRIVEFIKRNPKCAAWVDMGLGKSICTLTAFADALRSFEARRMLVVAPLRVARDVWDDEIETWSHLQGLTVSKIVGTKQQRLAGLSVPADIHTVNREQLAWLLSGYIQEKTKNKFRQIRRWPWDWVTLDESQSFKNSEASRSKAAKRISTFGLANRIVELTGTPSPNGYQDLWHPMYILDHGARLGASEDAFLERWFNPPPRDMSHTKWKIKAGAEKEIQALIADLVMSMKAEDYLDLPDVMYNEIRVRLSYHARQKYRQLERDCILELDEHTITAANAGVLGNKLLQLASGAMYVDDQGNFKPLHDAKLDALCEALDELTFSGPVLVGYGYKSDLARITERLAKHYGKRRRVAILRAADALKAFRQGDVDIGLIHPASAGHGLNDLHLSGSENIIWYGPTNNLELWDQLNARLAGGHRRMGKNVVVQVIIAEDTVDERYMSMIRSKDMDQTGLMLALRRENRGS